MNHLHRFTHASTALIQKPNHLHPSSSLLLNSSTSLSSCYNKLLTNIQTTIRTKMTKTKKRRLLKKANPPPYKPPHKFIDPTTPILSSPTLHRPSLASKPPSEQLSSLLSIRQSQNTDPPLRYNFTSLQSYITSSTSVSPSASPKLLKLFSLTNASTREYYKAQKARSIELFQLREGDTGSSSAQILALTSRIQQVQKHVSMHKKDYSGKRGLDALYVRRRKMLDYLERKDFDSYRIVVNALGLVR